MKNHLARIQSIKQLADQYGCDLSRIDDPRLNRALRSAVENHPNRAAVMAAASQDPNPRQTCLSLVTEINLWFYLHEADLTPEDLNDREWFSLVNQCLDDAILFLEITPSRPRLREIPYHTQRLHHEDASEITEAEEIAAGLADPRQIARLDVAVKHHILMTWINDLFDPREDLKALANTLWNETADTILDEGLKLPRINDDQLTEIVHRAMEHLFKE